MAIRDVSVDVEEDLIPGELQSDWDESSRGTLYRAKVRRDGSVTVPAFVRKLMELEAGGEIEWELTMSGLTLRPIHGDRDPDQWWYWTEAWQKGESEVDEDIRAGNTRHFDSTEAFLAALEEDSH